MRRYSAPPPVLVHFRQRLVEELHVLFVFEVLPVPYVVRHEPLQVVARGPGAVPLLEVELLVRALVVVEIPVGAFFHRVDRHVETDLGQIGLHDLPGGQHLGGVHDVEREGGDVGAAFRQQPTRRLDVPGRRCDVEMPQEAGGGERGGTPRVSGIHGLQDGVDVHRQADRPADGPVHEGRVLLAHAQPEDGQRVTDLEPGAFRHVRLERWNGSRRHLRPVDLSGAHRGDSRVLVGIGIMTISSKSPCSPGQSSFRTRTIFSPDTNSLIR